MLLKYCPNCDHANPATASFCAECDFDLLTVPAEPERGAEVPQTAISGAAPGGNCVLELLDNPEIRFHIAPGQSVGRGVESDVILGGAPHLGYISRRHALFSKRGEQWFVQYVATGNFIKVDGEEVRDDSLMALHDGSILTLSLTSFRVVLS